MKKLKEGIKKGGTVLTKIYMQYSLEKKEENEKIISNT